MDLGLPDMEGLEVISRVRAFAPAVPILVVSAYGEDRTKVEALDLGADDDYVVKPFAMPELLARVRAGLRRGAPAAGAGTPAPDHSELRIDLAARRVWVRGEEAHLTPTQFNVLHAMVRNTGACCRTA